MRQPSACAARLRLDIAPSRFVVLCAGASTGPIAPRDGIDTVILACAMLRQRHGIDAMLVVLGGEVSGDLGGDRGSDSANAPELARLQQLARELDVARHVRFAARRPHAAPGDDHAALDDDHSALDDYHAAADVFASTSWHASTAAACTVAQAMACALPVVGAAAGAIAAMVRDGVNGCLVPPRDPDTLCRCLARLQRQPLLARAMGMAGQARASATTHRKTTA